MACHGARRLVAAALLLAACAGMTAAQTAAPTSLYTYLFGENSDVVETKNGNYCGFTDAICADLVARTLPKLAYNRNEQMIFYMNVSINGTYEYAPFFPTVDKFTVFELPDCTRAHPVQRARSCGSSPLVRARGR